MAASRGQTPPVNLKERIAALQQRNVSPNTHQSAQATPRGLPSPGTGRLRDKIAKFEEKGGVPVPRGSFAMGAPQLAENAPTKKRGELYGNRLPGLGRPGDTPAGSRSGSPHPSADESPGPRKRCISTGTPLSSSPSSTFSTDEPVPALPNGPSFSAPRRNSLAVNFGSERRVMSSSDAEGKAVEFVDPSPPSLSSLVPETTNPQPLIPESAVGATLLEVEPSSLEAPEVTVLQPPEPPPVVEETLPAESGSSKVDSVAEGPPPVVEETLPTVSSNSKVGSPAEDPPPVVEETLPTVPGNSKVDTPAEDPPASRSYQFPLYDPSQNVSQSPSVDQSSKDGFSDYESAPQSAVSQPSPSLPEPAPPVPSSVPTGTPSVTPKPAPARTKTVVVTLSTPPSEKVTKRAVASRDCAAAIPAPNPTVPVPPSISTSNPTAGSPPQSKPTFKAVVHRKVTELPVTPAASRLAPPATLQSTKQRRGVNSDVVEVPSSPGHGDLAALLGDAAMLELRLTEGGSGGLRVNELLETTPTSATFQLDLRDPRHASASTLTEHAPMPSVDSGSHSMRSVSIPSIREPFFDGEIPEEDETDGRSLASTTFSQRSPSHRKYLSNIYRLTGRRSSSYMPGGYPRDSMSMSSEDSSPVTTPSDNGKRKGFGIGWPSASPKKGGPNVGRSSSFADKIFNRNRTKSNVSTVDQVSERGSLYESSQLSLSLSFPSELSPETNPDGVEIDTRPTSWISPGDSNSEFSPASSFLDKDIFDAFPSVPQTLPPGFLVDAENASVGCASTLPVNGRKQANPRISMA